MDIPFGGNLYIMNEKFGWIHWAGLFYWIYLFILWYNDLGWFAK